MTQLSDIGSDRLVDPQQYAKAILNILEDFESDKKWLQSNHRAVLNVLEDTDVDRSRVGAIQRALLNVLGDAEADKLRLEATQRALINIIDDFDSERNERRQAEAQVRALNDELELRVATRTQELTAANQELETFAYSVSHDLRTPLRAIDGFSGILVEEYRDRLDPEGQRIIGIVRAGAQKMAQLIDAILAFSRVGRSEMTATAVDMHELVQCSLAEIRLAIGERNVEFVISDLPSVRGDRVMLQRVWQNLLDNAVKYTSARAHAVITVGGAVVDGEAVYCVADNGVGFDMRYVQKLFGVFQRLHGPSEFPGSGIGLAIIKRIISRHGGRVWADGKPDAGATFHFALPVEEEPDV